MWFAGFSIWQYRLPSYGKMNVDHNTSDKVAHLGPESQGNVGYFWEEELLERIVLGREIYTMVVVMMMM